MRMTTATSSPAMALLCLVFLATSVQAFVLPPADTIQPAHQTSALNMFTRDRIGLDRGFQQSYQPVGGMVPYQSHGIVPSYGGYGTAGNNQYQPRGYDHGGYSYDFGQYGSGILDGRGRRTWSSPGYDPSVVSMGTPDGRPLMGELELYEGPNNTPQLLRVYSEDGLRNQFHTMVQPRPGIPHSMSVRNVGSLEFPMSTNVQPMMGGGYGGGGYGGGNAMSSGAPKQTIQGESLKTFQVGHGVQQVLVEMESQGGQIMATVELWEGPGQARVVAELYNDDGANKPFSAVLDTTGWYGSTIAVRNTSPLAFPIEASVTPYTVD